MIVAAGYLLGSVPAGLWLGRIAGVDVRAGGSGNTGATNVARLVGAPLAASVLFVDVAKGALAVAAARWLGAGEWVSALAGFAAIGGHVFPVFASFRGGKGVATAAGVFGVLAPAVLAVAMAAFGAVVLIFRIVSVASVSAAVVLPLSAIVLHMSAAVVVVAFASAATIVLTHRGNLRRLRAGREPRFRLR